MKLSSISIAVIALCAGAAAFAADAPPQSAPGNNRQALVQACRADAGRLCANVEPGGGRKLICLRGHLAELSPDCRDGLARLAAARKGDGNK